MICYDYPEFQTEYNDFMTALTQHIDQFLANPTEGYATVFICEVDFAPIDVGYLNDDATSSTRSADGSWTRTTSMSLPSDIVRRP